MVSMLFRKTNPAPPSPSETGHAFAVSYPAEGAPSAPPENPLRSFFNAHREGPGVWKWDHYFDAYHRHLQHLRGKGPRLVEIGIYSGGSLLMWQDYFGNPQIHGVDIAPACKAYEREGVRVHIGDQSDRAFWHQFKSEVPEVDIVIDDGGHEYEQQRVSFEELFPIVSPGGFYICEDIVGEGNQFAQYASGIANQLNHSDMVHDEGNPDRRVISKVTGLQPQIEFITLYPWMVVIQKRTSPLAELVGAKRGTQWEPHLR